MTRDLIEKAIGLVKSYRTGRPQDIKFSPTIPWDRGVPTLKPGVYRKMTPMLKERFDLFGRWETATHGHWLGLDDMEALWQKDINDDFLKRVQMQMHASAEGWPDHAVALFRPERLSIFAGDDNGYEEIYLLWLDCFDEPEVWAYDANGESRYKNLDEYLTAYVNSDISAAARSWRA